MDRLVEFCGEGREIISAEILSVATLVALLRRLPDGGEVTLEVSGESMVPFYRHRETVVTLRRETERAPRRGDALLFLRADGTPVLHRVVRVFDGYLTMGGDGQRTTETISPAGVLARVVRVRRLPAGREVRTDAPGYRLLVWLWSLGRWWHPRVAKWYRERGRGREHGHDIRNT